MKLLLETNLTELYAEVSKRVDTSGTSINAAETSRVCAMLFKVLNELPSDKMMLLLGHGLQLARITS